jgi:hypothetical protein
MRTGCKMDGPWNWQPAQAWALAVAARVSLVGDTLGVKSAWAPVRQQGWELTGEWMLWRRSGRIATAWGTDFNRWPSSFLLLAAAPSSHINYHLLLT